jgi:hypothetical protein
VKTTRVRGASAALAMAGVVVAAAACSSGSHPAPHVPGAMIDPPIGKLFDGPALAGMLGKLTYPPGFSPDAQSLADSGLVIAPIQDLGALTSQTCPGLTVALGNWGYGESSYASAGAMTADYGRGLSVFVYQFASDDGASVFYSTVKAQWSGCGSFTDDLSGIEQPSAMIAAPAPAVWGTSKAVDLSLSQTLDGIGNATDYVMGLDGDTVVFGEVTTSPGPEFTGGVQRAAGMAGDLLQEMNAAQLVTASPEADSGGPSQPYGRYGTGN